jgi:4-hydroxy-tetrahydrodipicolinate reductase
MIRAVLVGATGRMGQAIIRAAADAGDVSITAAVDSAESTLLGRDAGELAGVRALDIGVTCDLAAVLADADVVIDFSSPKATEEHLSACRKALKPLLLGTTGHGPALTHIFERAAREIALLVSPNTSLGATVLLELARAGAGALPREFDAEIIESHHRMKKDAPSGTALALGAAVAQGRGGQLTDMAVMDRQRGAMRRSGDIGFAVVRGGDLVGQHTVVFAGDGEELTLTHRAWDRSIFAKGALRAAAWLTVQPPGRYTMGDILLQKTGC